MTWRDDKAFCEASGWDPECRSYLNEGAARKQHAIWCAAMAHQRSLIADWLDADAERIEAIEDDLDLRSHIDTEKALWVAKNLRIRAKLFRGPWPPPEVPE